jgi:RimJ/RimL family protein N-acetyltransferase
MDARIKSILGRHINLRPFLTEDFERVYAWRSNSYDLHLWFQKPEILSIEEFIDDFNGFIRNFVHILMIVETFSGDAIGMTYSYKADYLNGHAFLCTYIDSQHRGFLYGAEASLLFVDHLFSYFSFRKLYAEIYEHNAQSLKNAIKGGWIEEGRLKSHRWYSDGYKDLHIFALYRKGFYDKFGRLLPSLKADYV